MTEAEDRARLHQIPGVDVDAGAQMVKLIKRHVRRTRRSRRVRTRNSAVLAGCSIEGRGFP